MLSYSALVSLGSWFGILRDLAISGRAKARPRPCRFQVAIPSTRVAAAIECKSLGYQDSADVIDLAFMINETYSDPAVVGALPVQVAFHCSSAQ